MNSGIVKYENCLLPPLEVVFVTEPGLMEAVELN